MAFLGCDDEELRALGRRLIENSHGLEEQMGRLGSLVVSARWEGPDGERFRSDFDSTIRRPAATTARLMAAAGRSAIQNADEQTAASSADGDQAESAGGNDNASAVASKPLEETDSSGRLEPIPEIVKEQIDDPDEILAKALDTTQGDMGDCFFLASLAAAAERDPEFIERNIWYSDGKYHVRLYEQHPYGPLIEKVVDVEPEAASRGVTDSSKNMTWMTVYEAAYAKHKGGYDKIENGGFAQEALPTITGGYARTTDSEPSFDSLKKELSKGSIIVADTTSPDGDGTPEWMFWLDHDGPVPQDTVPRHQYVVKGFTEDGKIIMQNPWGKDGGRHEGVFKPGELVLTEDEYRDRFENVTVGQPRMSDPYFAPLSLP